MTKSFIKGGLWGAGVSAVALVAFSIGQGVSNGPNPWQNSAARKAASAAPGANKVEGPDGPSAVGLVASDVPAPRPDTLAALLADALEPAAVPQTGPASGLETAQEPKDDAMSGIANASGKAPVLGEAGSGSLTTPATEPSYSVSTDPAQPLAPKPVPQATAFADAGAEAKPATEDKVALSDPLLETAETAQQGEASPDALAEMSTTLQQPSGFEDTAAGSALQPQEPDAPARPVQQVVAVATTPMAPPRAETSRIYPAQNGPRPATALLQPQPASFALVGSVKLGTLEMSAPAPARATLAFMPAPTTADPIAVVGSSATAQVDAEIGIEVVAPVPVVSGDATPGAAPISPAPGAPKTGPLPAASPGDPSLSLEVRDPAAPSDVVVAQAEAPARPANEVRINRLPSLGDDTPEPTEPDPAEEDAVADAVPQEDQPPAQRFASAFDAPAGKPLLAVVLLDVPTDQAGQPVAVAAVRNLPYPVSIAVDPLAPDAQARMAEFRAAGFEVLASVDLPPGATASDAEVNIQAAFETLPEVIGILEGPGTGIQSSPAAGRQVAEILAETGHGFVSQNSGLNTGQKLAARQGVPSDVVFRDLDTVKPGEAVIRRFMDQAAFRAARDGSVVMLGRLTPETLSALLSWSLQDRASTVAMAPVSAILLQDPES